MRARRNGFSAPWRRERDREREAIEEDSNTASIALLLAIARRSTTKEARTLLPIERDVDKGSPEAEEDAATCEDERVAAEAATAATAMTATAKTAAAAAAVRLRRRFRRRCEPLLRSEARIRPAIASA